MGDPEILFFRVSTFSPVLGFYILTQPAGVVSGRIIMRSVCDANILKCRPGLLHNQQASTFSASWCDNKSKLKSDSTVARYLGLCAAGLL